MRHLLTLIIALSCLVGCSSERGTAGVNIVCAFVEGYFDTKTLIMTRPPNEAIEMAQGMTPTPEEVSSSFDLDSKSREILTNFRSAMVKWAMAFQEYSVTGDEADFASSGLVLEGEIDLLANQCSSQGWDFPSDWVHNTL